MSLKFRVQSFFHDDIVGVKNEDFENDYGWSWDGLGGVWECLGDFGIIWDGFGRPKNDS